ncbi:MAG: DUF2520 domain-containing protein [Myxococcales bacterium]|nr:DUF2520 domain-containing protein [Myxococcales bacterium]
MPPRPSRPKKAPRARWQRRHPASKPRVLVVGFGRVGGALARGLKKAGWPVAVLPRSDESVRRAVKLNLRLADHENLKEADLCLLAVPDAVVGRLAASLRDDLGAGTALIHCAGALDLSAFGTDPEMLRRARGSFHPLCAVSDAQDDLSGHAVALAASQRELMPVLWRMALALRLRPIEVPEARRAAYHAGAVMAAGLLVALASGAVAAFEEAGVIEDQALGALLPLMRSAIRGVEVRGLIRGLTGPVARGDISVVQAHLSALPAELADIYRALSLRSLKLVRDQLPAETRNALERLLKA